MAFEFRLPDIGEGVVEGEVVEWKVAEGDTIEMDQPMVEVMTDKATVEIPSPAAGKVAKLMFKAGEVCAVGEVMIVIDDGGAAVASAPAEKSAAVAKSQPAPAPAAQAAPVAKSQPAPAPAPAAQAAPVASLATAGGRVLATPATRRLAREMNVDLSVVVPTGPHGRVTTDDVRKSENGAAAPAPATAAASRAQGTRPPVRVEPSEGDERVPFRGVRKAIAANMTRSKFTATHFTYVEELDVSDLVALRRSAKDKLAEQGIRLTYLPFFVKAVVTGLKKWPAINASLDESTQEIVYKKHYHIGIATQGPQGLSVGVVRNCDRLSLIDISREIGRLSEAIRDGKATRQDLTGSTFTISSLGQLGGVLATPIINFPESAIMGVHKIAEKPAVFNGEIAIRHLMNLSISVDHRIADGYDGAMFLQEVKTQLESPALMFMEMV